MIKNLTEAYQGKKVFVTGHTGFKGSWMLAVLHELGAIVKGYALEPEGNLNLFNLLDGETLAETLYADIREQKKLEEELLKFQPDYVFHLAAQALVRRSYDEPKETYEVNVIGTLNLLEALRKLDKKCSVVIVTTDKVYENCEEDYPYKETDSLGGYDPYSSSKACAEILTASYRRSFFNDKDNQISIATARAGNVIGGGDWAIDRIIPDLVRAMDAGETLTVRNPLSVRPWQHVLEPVCAYLHLGAKMNENPIEFASAFNFGPETTDVLTVQQLIEKALEIWGHGSSQNLIDPHAPHEAKLLQLDISKAKTLLGWQPKWNSSQSIEKTIEWYMQYRNGTKEVTYGQIQEYLSNYKLRITT